MKRTFWKKTLALVLAGTSALSLCACGGSNGSSSKKSDKTYYKATYVDLPESFGENMYYASFVGDKVYYGGNNDDYTESSIHVYDLDSQEDKTIWTSGEFDTSDGSVDISNLSANTNGYVLCLINESHRKDNGKDYSATTLDDVLQYMQDQWGYDYNGALSDWNDYYLENYTDDDGNPNYGKALQSFEADFVYENNLTLLDPDGNILWKQNLGDEERNTNVCSAVLSADDQVIALVNTWTDSSDDYYIDIFDTNGNLVNQITLDTYADSLIVLPDGSVGYRTWGDVDYECNILDLNSGKVTDTYTIPSNTTYVQDDTHLYVTGDSALQSYDLKSQETTNIFGWLDVELSSSNISCVGTSSDGRIMVLSRSYSASTGEYATELAYVDEADASEFEGITYLTFACQYLDWSLEQLALEFNRKHNDVKIRVETFDSASDYETNYSQFITAISTDSDIDMVCFNEYSQVLNLAGKGMLADLTPILEANGSFTTGDIVPGIVNACTVDGKLVALPTGFSLNTLVGKTANVGSEMGWNLDQAMQVWDNFPDSEFSTACTRTDMLQYLVSLNYNSFVNSADGSCDFDNDEFVKILEFSNRFPEEIDWDTYEWDDNRFVNDQVLTDTFYLSDLYNLQSLNMEFGGDYTMVGYPSANTNGACFSFNSTYGITENCEDTAAAWEFLEQLYLSSSSESGDIDVTYISAGSYDFSILSADLDKKCQEAMNPDNDSIGEVWGYGDYTYTVRAATQEEVDVVKNLVNGTTAVYGAAGTSVMDLISEEVAYYFNGERTAEEVASKVQSRMSIYLSETN